MEKSATTIEEQLSLLESRGLHIENTDKAKEILRDIGYYRLGFYLFPFEKTYPELKNRTHEYKEGATFEDAVSLYYFDFDLRLILMRYLNRIEIAFRTGLIYYMSNKYKDNVIWFADKAVMNRHYIADFEKKIYTSDFRKNPVIKRHHQKHPDDRFAPAWKTLEYMTFGGVLKLYEQLEDKNDKIFIAHMFGIKQVITFESYMHTIRQVRNACAHGLVLYDLKLPRRIKRGPADLSPRESGNIIGSLRVIRYIINQISINRSNDMVDSVRVLYKNLCSKAPILKSLLVDFSLI